MPNRTEVIARVKSRESSAQKKKKKTESHDRRFSWKTYAAEAGWKGRANSVGAIGWSDVGGGGVEFAKPIIAVFVIFRQHSPYKLHTPPSAISVSDRQSCLSQWFRSDSCETFNFFIFARLSTRSHYDLIRRRRFSVLKLKKN